VDQQRALQTIRDRCALRRTPRHVLAEAQETRLDLRGGHGLSIGKRSVSGG
jgi:hypothetical protein